MRTLCGGPAITDTLAGASLPFRFREASREFVPLPSFFRLEMAGPPAAPEFEAPPPVAPDPTTAGFLTNAPPNPIEAGPRMAKPARTVSKVTVKLPDFAASPEYGVRKAARPATPAPHAASASPEAMEAAGPGFSGMLAWPAPASPILDRPQADEPAAESEPKAIIRNLETGAALEAEPEPVPPPRALDRMLDIWQEAPSYARGMVFTVGIGLAALMLAPSLTSSAPAAGATETSEWKEAVRARAEFTVENNLQSAEGWSGKEGWEASWSFDRTGARPGKLALIEETIPRTNYQMEFLGQIDAKALGFVLHAKDTANYHAVKLLITKPGPLPTLELVHYPVIDGKEGPKKRLPMPIHARMDTLYKTVVTVQGENVSVNINGVAITSWTEDIFRSGGVGFFADKGEAAHVLWVHVQDQKDFLGWLCSQVSRWTADRRETGAKQ